MSSCDADMLPLFAAPGFARRTSSTDAAGSLMGSAAGVTALPRPPPFSSSSSSPLQHHQGTATGKQHSLPSGATILNCFQRTLLHERQSGGGQLGNGPQEQGAGQQQPVVPPQKPRAVGVRGPVDARDIARRGV